MEIKESENTNTNILPKVLIILVNYNGYSDTILCVKSLLENNYSNYQILIVENGSNDNQKIANDLFLNNHAKIIISDTNLGFSGGNNIGIEYAIKNNFEYVLLLNNDTVVTPNFLSELVQCAIEKQAAITTGNIAFYNNKEKLWYSGGKYNFETGITYMNWGEKFKSNLPQNVTFSSGCLMLISIKYINKHGMFSNDYFMYSEDTEFCCRAIANKENIVWNPNALIYHKISVSSKTNSRFQQYYLIRNNFYIIQEFGINKSRAYLQRVILSFKEILKGRYNIIPLLDAIMDFKRGVKGKSPKY